MSTGLVGSLELVDELEVRSAVEWAQVRAMAADGVTQREIARRLGINRRTVRRLLEASEPPRHERAPAGSMLDPLVPVICRVMQECPQIRPPRVTELLREDYGYVGLVDLVRRRMAALRPVHERPAQRTGYRPGQVIQVEWAEMPTRPRIAGRERRVYALICSLPYSGAATAHFSFDMTIESFLEGHVRAVEWLGDVPRECVYDNLRAAVARRDGDVVTWSARFVQLRGHYAFHATACTPATPREKGSVRCPKSAFWPARRFSSLAGLDDVYIDWRDRVALPRRHASAGHVVASVWSTSASTCERCRRRALMLPGDGPRGFRSTATSSTPAASTAHRKRWCISAWSCAGTAIASGSSTAAGRSRATRAAISPGPGCRRRGCAPSRRRRRR